MARIPASALTVFTLGGDSMVCHAEECVINSSIESEDGSCINEVGAEPVAMGRARSISAQGLVDDEAVFMQLIEASNPVVTVAVTSGANTYSGSALITSASHTIARRQLQRQSIELQIIGALSVTAPA